MPCASVLRIAFISGLWALSGEIFADTVKLHGKPAFRNVRVTNFTQGRVVFQGVSREFLRKPLSDVEWLETGANAALGPAEQAAARRDWDAAVEGYRAALKAAGTDWERALVTARLAAVCDAAGRFDEAVELYVGMLETEDEPPVRPRHPAAVGSEVNARAIKLLAGALVDAPRGVRRDKLQSLLVELRICEDPGVSLASVLGEQEVPEPTSKPAVSPILGLRVAPPTEESKRVEFHLVEGSLLIDVAKEAVRTDEAQRARDILVAALPLFAGADRPLATLQLGRARVVLGEYAAAADELLKLSAAAGESALAAEALYYAGVAHEGLGQSDVARQEYRAVLERAAASQALRAAARAGLARIGE